MIQQAILRLLVIAVALTAPLAQANELSGLYKWDSIHREFARRSLSLHLVKNFSLTWGELDEYFTQEARERLSARTNHALSAEAGIDDLLLHDALITHQERLGLPANFTWDNVVTEQLALLRFIHGYKFDYFVISYLFDDQVSFWDSQAAALFPIPNNEAPRLREDDDTY